MKIKKEHLEYLKSKILPNVTGEMIHDYETGDFARSEKTKDLQMRFNFDMLCSFVGSAWVCENLYKYLNDDHIKSALNSFMPKVTRRF